MNLNLNGSVVLDFGNVSMRKNDKKEKPLLYNFISLVILPRKLCWRTFTPGCGADIYFHRNEMSLAPES